MEKVIKRNGTLVDFDNYKITIAIFSALNESKEGAYETAQELSNKVVEKINHNDKMKVEDIQDVVEEVLMTEGYCKTARKYILYREDHKQQREFESDLMKRIAQIDKETERDNANIGHNPASKMYQMASEASKQYYLNKLIPKHLSKLHKSGDIHIHDLDYYSKTFNCLSIPLEQLLRTGYNGEYGYVNSPKRIKSAMDLAANILQRASNDIFGGTMFPNIDITIENLINDKIIEEPKDKDLEQACQSLLYNLATMPTRAGNQIPFSSITFGLGVGVWARKISYAILKEFEKGMGKGETFIFPNLVFKVKEGINFNLSDHNYDLYRYALKVSCLRMNPTFAFMDNAGNQNFPAEEINPMGCRSRIVANCNGKSQSEKRGNIFPTTINLPKIALKTKGSHYEKDIKDFWKRLDKMLCNVKELSLHRWNILNKLKVKDIPFIFGENVYYDASRLNPEETIEESLKHGTIAVGYVGIAECLKELVGCHHGESDRALELALEINKKIRDFCDSLIKETSLNWSCYATPAESTCNKVLNDREEFGIIKGVTDKDYYTNSYHIPVYFPITIARKITIEGQFHKYNNGGHITYIELDEAPIHNVDGVEQILKHMKKSDVGYCGINFPKDECLNIECRNSGVFNDCCTKCGGDNIRKLRRISGYLGIESRINYSKKQEINERLKHNKVISGI
jgi:ribonucleoside-triphosphate reductase